MLACAALPRNNEVASLQVVNSYFRSVLQCGEILADTDLVARMLTQFDYILVDDAQAAPYLFMLLCKAANSGKARVVFFASIAPESFHVTTPAVPGRLGWDEFRLSKQEQTEICDKFFNQVKTADPDDSKRLQWLQRMLPALQRDTAGHAGPGLLRLAAMQLWEESWNDKTLMHLEGEEFAVAMERHYPDAVFHSLVAKRVGLVAVSQQFDDVTRKVLREVIANQTVAAPPDERGDNESEEVRAKRALMRAVILVPVADGGSRVLQFATPMHARFWFREAYPSRISSEHF
jgi:hypothetical protein